MLSLNKIKEQINEDGFCILNNVFSDNQINSIANLISTADHASSTFRKSSSLFAIRQFLKEIPEAIPKIFTSELKSIIHKLFGENYFIVKSIYFDKPGESNWFVSYHQDLTISVAKKYDVNGYGPWTVKQNQFAVQPPLNILEENFTIRIHLDDTNERNGALRVIPKSHLKGIFKPETIDWKKESEVSCNVLKGGIMIMRPLLLHASNRTTNNMQRRVIHIEFSNKSLEFPLEWSEFSCITPAGNIGLPKAW